MVIEGNAILASREIIAALQRSKNVHAAIGGAATRSIASLAEVNALLGSYGLPGLVSFSKSVNIGGQAKKVLSPKKLFFLPAPGTSELGQTVNGLTAEAGDPEYGIPAGTAPGLVASTLKQADPYSYWVRANAIALPVMTNPDASMVATVLNA